MRSWHFRQSNRLATGTEARRLHIWRRPVRSPLRLVWMANRGITSDLDYVFIHETHFVNRLVTVPVPAVPFIVPQTAFNAIKPLLSGAINLAEIGAANVRFRWNVLGWACVRQNI